MRSRGHGRPRPSDGRRQARQALSHRGADRGPGSRNAAVSDSPGTCDFFALDPLDPRVLGRWSGRQLLLQLFHPKVREEYEYELTVAVCERVP